AHRGDARRAASVLLASRALRTVPARRAGSAVTGLRPPIRAIGCELGHTPLRSSCTIFLSPTSRRRPMIVRTASAAQRAHPPASRAALAPPGLALGAGCASAAVTAHGGGEAPDVTVPGALVVGKNNSCVLDGVTIEGAVHVRAGADLVMSDSSVAERVVVAPDAYLDASDSEVGGNVVSRSGYGVYLEDSSVGGAFQGRLAEEDASPFLYSYDTSIDGRVNVEQGLVHLQTVTVGGPVTTSGTSYTD